MKQFFILFTVLAVSICISAQDIIVTKDSRKIEAKISEVSKSEIKYKELDNIDGPTFILSTDEISSVIYSNGKVVLYDQFDKSKEQEKMSYRHSVDTTAINIARVKSFSGVYVFTDCIPVSEYEVLGDVNMSAGEGASLAMSYSMGGSGVSMSPAIVLHDEPQYSEFRNGLVAQAIMANRQVEGIIISIENSSKARATLIKFKDNTSDKSLAKVNSRMGLYIFTDCMPVNSYTFVGKIKGAGAMSPNYNTICDKLVKKVRKKYPEAQGTIITLVTGGKDSAEAIKF